MYPSSTQKKYWTFFDKSELQNLREKANKDFILKFNKGNKESDFLTYEEESQLLSYYEQRLLIFCKTFEPKLPLKVIGTAFHYFKRFYLNNSVMDHIPRDVLVTCVYLSCKTEEFFIRMGRFIQNVKGDRKKAADIILDKEMTVIQKLNNQLTVWNPYTPLEGILLQLKASNCLESPQKVELLRPAIDEFLEKILLTDSFLLYSPSQIALASVMHAVNQTDGNIDSYVIDTFLASPPPEILDVVKGAVKEIRKSVYKLQPPPDAEVINKVEEKLQHCRNPVHDVDTPQYAARVQAHERLSLFNSDI